jgi:uncharacterized protein
MSEQQNTQLVQQAYAAFKRGDINGVLNIMADDVVWFLPGPPDIIPVTGQRRGKNQVAQFFAKLSETQEPEEFEPKQFIAQGDTVVSLGHYRWKVKATGRRFESDFAHVFTIRNGKVTNFHEYFDTNAGVAAYSTGQAAAR